MKSALASRRILGGLRGILETSWWDDKLGPMRDIETGENWEEIMKHSIKPGDVEIYTDSSPLQPGRETVRELWFAFKGTDFQIIRWADGTLDFEISVQDEENQIGGGASWHIFANGTIKWWNEKIYHLQWQEDLMDSLSAADRRKITNVTFMACAVAMRKVGWWKLDLVAEEKTA